jgi:hypothetical protein
MLRCVVCYFGGSHCSIFRAEVYAEQEASKQQAEYQYSYNLTSTQTGLLTFRRNSEGLTKVKFCTPKM